MEVAVCVKEGEQRYILRHVAIEVLHTSISGRMKGFTEAVPVVLMEPCNI